MNRVAMIAGISILVAAGAVSSIELSRQGEAADMAMTAGLAPRTYTGPVCSSYREWPASPYIYRYCANRQNGYEAQRDDYYKTTSIRYLGSQLVDCDSTQGWKPTGGNMKTYYCP